MTIDLALSDDHDLALDLVGRASLIDGAAKVAQQIKVTLLAFLGEWFLDTSFGVPYFEHVLVKVPNRAAVEAAFRARIGDVPGVSRVRRLGLEIDHSRRLLRVSYEADTSAGLLAQVVDLHRP
ncbi:hypothetical protein [Achromobacter insuavis]|uniref:hypothetical protein n=1 Tax=Achromobacter insuavis TaxID=1287735 RepID=UPI001F13A051|nr:hypothetical protein [Achromobacter insuavis]